MWRTLIGRRGRRRASRSSWLQRRPELEWLEDRNAPSVSFLGNEFLVGPNTDPLSDQSPAVAMDAAGNSVVVWETRGIQSRSFDANGAAMGAATTLVQNSQIQPAIARDAAGNYVVAYFSFNDGNVHALRFDATGVQQGSDIVVGPTGTYDNLTWPSVALTPTGFAVFWDRNDAYIHGQEYDHSGNPLAAISIPEPTTVIRPRAAADASGNFVVVYSTNNSSANSAGPLFAQRIASNGSATGSAFAFTVSTAAEMYYPNVVVEPSGTFAVTWANYGDAAGAIDSANGLYLRLFNADGTPQADPVRIAAGGSRSGAPIATMATDAAGDFVVAWEDTGTHVATAQLFNATGMPLTTAIPMGTYGVNPAVAFAASGSRFMVAYANLDNVLVDFFAVGANQAPVVDPSVPVAFTFVKEGDGNPPGDSVSFVFGPAITDLDAGAFMGIAVNGLTGGANGTWQYSLNGGVTWAAFGAVSDAAALLLRGSDLIRFVPNAGFLGDATLGFHAWDQTSGVAGSTAELTAGTGGATAFSAVASTATLSVTLTGNYAPVVDTTYAAVLTEIPPDSTPPGNTIAQIVGPSITDRNPGDSLGIALTALTGTANGAWQFSLDAGATWTQVGDVTTSAALLLRGSDMVRFVPNLEFVGTATIGYHAWDETQGSSGGTADLTSLDPIAGAFSVAQATATATVSRFILTGATLDVYGSPGNDTFSFIPGGRYNAAQMLDPTTTVTLNGETHTYVGSGYPPTNAYYEHLTVNFHGGGGSDTASVDMRNTAAIAGGGIFHAYGTATIGDGFTTLTKAGYQNGPHAAWYYTVNLLNVPNVYLNAASGDLVQMFGSTAGPNTFVSTPTYSYMVGPTGQFYVVSGVGGDVIAYNNVHGLGALYAYGHSMPGDQAWFYGSGGADTLVMSGSAFTYMSGTGFFNVAAGFTNTLAIASGGQSAVYYLDSPGNDVYWGTASASYLSGPGYFDAAYGFAMVYAQSFVGGTDYAYNYDPYHVITSGRWIRLA